MEVSVVKGENNFVNNRDGGEIMVMGRIRPGTIEYVCRLAESFYFQCYSLIQF